jgi:hypothetical protein
LNAGWLAGTRIAVCNRCDIMPVRQVQGKAKVQLVRPLYPKPKALFVKAFAILVKRCAGRAAGSIIRLGRFATLSE